MKNNIMKYELGAVTDYAYEIAVIDRFCESFHMMENGGKIPPGRCLSIRAKSREQENDFKKYQR